MSKNKRRWPSAVWNNFTFIHYHDILRSLAINRFKWENLPDTCDYRFLELNLYNKGQCLFFYDEILDIYITLPAMISGKWDIYNIPIERTAYATNNYRYKANNQNSVLIWNDYMHKPLVSTVQYYAYKLYEIERAIDTNIKLQKYPGIIKTSESQRLVMANLMEQYEGNEPFIYGDQALDLTGIDVLNFNAPYVADKLNQLKVKYFNEFLTFIGVENNNNEKKERLISDEISSNYGSIEAFRNIGLNSRTQACEQINRMYGLNVEVYYNSDLPTMVNAAMNDNLKIDKQREITQEEKNMGKEDSNDE